MLTAALAVLCALLVLVLLVQRPAIWPVLVVLAVLWFALFGVFRYRVRSWVARWVCGGSFEKSKTQFSLEPLSQPAAPRSTTRSLAEAEAKGRGALDLDDVLTRRRA